MRSSILLAGAALLPALLCLGAALPAQNGVGAHIIALDRGNGVNEPPKLWPIVACRLRTKCDLPQLMTHASPVGGTTFDATDDREWSSDGRRIVSSSTGCKFACGVQIPATMASITGMGINRPRGWLYTSHADDYIRIWTDAPDCTLQLLGSCEVKNLVAGELITGIEFDSRNDPTHPRGRLFCVTTRGYLIVLEEPTPTFCQEICRVTLPSCSTGRFMNYTGLSYDPTHHDLFVTDGKAVMTVREQNSCSLQHIDCCLVCVGQCYEFTGLGWHSGELGLDPRTQPCADPLCGCAPQIGGDGVPSVRNPNFRVTLDHLRPDGVSVLLLALGDPTSGLPLFCGSFYLNPTPLLVALPAPHTGTGSCAGSAAVPIGFLPPVLAGQRLSAQGATACPGSSATGFALSAALWIEVGW